MSRSSWGAETDGDKLKIKNRIMDSRYHDYRCAEIPVIMVIVVIVVIAVIMATIHKKNTRRLQRRVPEQISRKAKLIFIQDALIYDPIVGFGYGKIV